MSDVTVIVPVYEGRAFLDQALASVAGQSRRPDAVVVVDDGSSDDSGAVAGEWSDRLPVRVIRHERNAGLCQARRTGIASAATALVALLDADDVWLPDHLDAMVSTFERAGGLITAKALRWVPGQSLASEPSNGWSLPPAQEQLRRLLVMNFVFVGTLFERTLYESVGGFRDGRNGAEDWDLWARMLLAGTSISSPGIPTVLYRVHGGSMSADDALIESELAVLGDLWHEVPARLRPVVELSLRHRQARLALRTAYEHARRGSSWKARRAAVGAFRGPTGVRTRAAALCVLPTATVRARDAARADASRIVGR
jgi:glycosyltransferase involved in cell wall biosynthesis